MPILIFSSNARWQAIWDGSVSKASCSGLEDRSSVLVRGHHGQTCCRPIPSAYHLRLSRLFPRHFASIARACISCLAERGRQETHSVCQKTPEDGPPLGSDAFNWQGSLSPLHGLSYRQLSSNNVRLYCYLKLVLTYWIFYSNTTLYWLKCKYLDIV